MKPVEHDWAEKGGPADPHMVCSRCWTAQRAIREENQDCLQVLLRRERARISYNLKGLASGETGLRAYALASLAEEVKKGIKG
jgi:hypothetical protein